MLNISWFVTLVNLFSVNSRAWWRFWEYKYPMAVSETICLYLLQRNHLVSPFNLSTIVYKVTLKAGRPSSLPSQFWEGREHLAAGHFSHPNRYSGALGRVHLGQTECKKCHREIRHQRQLHTCYVLYWCFMNKKHCEVIVTVKASGPPNWFGLFIVLNFFSSLFRRINEGFSKCVWNKQTEIYFF